MAGSAVVGVRSGKWRGDDGVAKVKLVRLSDEVDPEAVVRLLVDAGEPTLEIKVAGRDEGVIGPQPEGPSAHFAGSTAAAGQ